MDAKLLASLESIRKSLSIDNSEEFDRISFELSNEDFDGPTIDEYLNWELLTVIEGLFFSDHTTSRPFAKIGLVVGNGIGEGGTFREDFVNRTLPIENKYENYSKGSQELPFLFLHLLN